MPSKKLPSGIRDGDLKTVESYQRAVVRMDREYSEFVLGFRKQQEKGVGKK